MGDRIGGTSNEPLATRGDLEAIGTNAHELPIVAGTLGRNDADRAAAPIAGGEAIIDW